MSDIDNKAHHIREIRASLLEWYQKQKRDLPWRKRQDGYGIWLSEIMLQQTQVKTVLPYYKLFLENFPTITDLARADLSKVLTLWSGLGYYRRAKNLHKAAQVVDEQFGGIFPDNPKDIMSLPGVGRYTTGAISSIAFGLCEPLVDGNVQRVFARLFLLRDPVGSKQMLKDCWDLAERLVEGENPGDFNQSLMELGATLCTKGKPACLLCPVNQWCQAKEVGEENELPVPKPRKAQTEMYVYWAAVRRSGKLLLLKRPSDGLFADMWELPGIYLKKKPKEPQDILLEQLESIGLSTALRDDPQPFTHVLTHRRLHIQLYQCRSVKGRLSLPKEQWSWIPENDLPDLAISSITRKILQSLTTSK